MTNDLPSSTGFQADITIRNTGTAPINGRTLRSAFANGLTIAQLWNAAFTQTGPNVSVQSNQSWNGDIAPGASVNAFGFTGIWSGANVKPASFALNGGTCAIP